MARIQLKFGTLPSDLLPRNIDPEKFAYAKSRLGIQFPVEVRYHGKGYRTQGTHRTRYCYAPSILGEKIGYEGNYHLIILSRNQSPQSQNVTLWHELAHAMQAERFHRAGGLFTSFYRLYYKPSDGERGASYRENKCEIQAREIEVQFGSVVLIPWYNPEVKNA